MATSNVTPLAGTITHRVETDLSTILTALDNQAKTLSSKHLQVSGLIVAVLIGALALLGFVVKHEVSGYDKALAAAQAVQAQYQNQLKASEQERQQVEAQLKQLSQEQQTVTHTVVQRDAQAAQETHAVQALKSVSEIANSARQYLNTQPTITPTNDLSLTPPQVQGIIENTIKGDTAQLDLKDTTNLLQIEEQKTVSLTDEVQTLTTTVSKCNQTVASYEKAAKKSKFRRILDGTAHVGEIALGAFVGYEVGHL